MGGSRDPVAASGANPEDKLCATCGRAIQWRKKWERDWADVRFCREGCKQSKPDATDKALEAAILRLLRERGRNKTICPSEAARNVAGEEENLWRPLMERTRAAARRLVNSGTIAITQGGRVVDPSRAKGAIRLKLK